MLFDQIINAILLGSMYAVVAIGFSLFFGVLNVVVFSCGDIAVAGAFSVLIMYGVTKGMGLFHTLPFFLVVLIIVVASALITGVLGVVAYRAAIKPFEGKSELMPLLSTIALGVIIREVIGLWFPQGRNPQVFPNLMPEGFLFGIRVLSYERLIILLITMLMLTALFLIVTRTRFGQSIMAISQNREAAIMMGVNPGVIVPLTFMLGGFLLGVGGFIIGTHYNIVTFMTGSMYGLKGFSAAVIGGLGSIYGAIVGGLLIAVVEVFVAGYVPGGAAYMGVTAFLVVVLFMIFRPQGILGETTIKKV